MLFHLGCLVAARRAKEVVEHLEHEVSGKLCKKTFLSGCQPAAVCEQDYEGYCDLKYDEDLVLEFESSKSSLFATAAAYHADHRLSDLVRFIPSLQRMIPYSKAFQEVSPTEVPLLAASMNSSTSEFLESVSKVTAALEEQGGQAVNFSTSDREDTFERHASSIASYCFQKKYIHASSCQFCNLRCHV